MNFDQNKLMNTLNTCWNVLPKLVFAINRVPQGDYTYKNSDIKIVHDKKPKETLIYLQGDSEYPMAGVISKDTLEFPAISPKNIPHLENVCELYNDLSKGDISGLITK